MNRSLSSLAAVAATAAAVMAAAAPASADVYSGRSVVYVAAAETGAPSAEELGRALYYWDVAIQQGKAAVPLAYARAALEAGDVFAALDISRKLSLDGCRFHGTVDGVLRTDCARVEILQLIASTGAGARHVDWRTEIWQLDIGETLKRDLLTSVAVKQGQGGDLNGAVSTAKLHGRGDAKAALEVVSALAPVAVIAAEAGKLRRAIALIREAHRRCNGSWCGKDSRGAFIDSGYRYDLQWALARISMHRAKMGDLEGAKFAIGVADDLVGGGDWRDRAQRSIALELARQGRLLDAAETLPNIRRKEWRIEVEREVKEIFADSS